MEELSPITINPGTQIVPTVRGWFRWQSCLGASLVQVCQDTWIHVFGKPCRRRSWSGGQGACPGDGGSWGSSRKVLVVAFAPRPASFEPQGPSRWAARLGALTFLFCFDLLSFKYCGTSCLTEAQKMNMKMWFQYHETHLFSNSTGRLCGFPWAISLPFLPLSCQFSSSTRWEEGTSPIICTLYLLATKPHLLP